jgi:hypothetical protein
MGDAREGEVTLSEREERERFEGLPTVELEATESATTDSLYNASIVCNGQTSHPLLSFVDI